MADSDLHQKIIGELEYSFAESLPKDKITEDDGWVPLEIILKFKRLSDLSEDPKVIVEALEKSETNLFLLNEDKTKIKRNPEKPLPKNPEHMEQQAKSDNDQLNEDETKIKLDPEKPLPKTGEENNKQEGESDNDLHQKIIKQVEYYFGDISLPRDKFLQEKIKEDDGWVPLEIMLKFRRLASLSEDPKVIVEALEKSENKLVSINEDKTKIRRNPEKPLPENRDEHMKQLQAKSAYAKGFPTNESIDEIIKFMETHGQIESIIRRTTRDHKFKGSCFIVFKDVESAKKFVNLESVKYKETELLRKMQNDYHADKIKEIEEKKRIQKEKKQAVVKESAEKIDFPSGAILHFTGIAEGQDLTREEIKEKLKEASKMEVIYIDYNKGDSEGYARFGKENNAIDFFKTLIDGELEIGEHKLKTKTLEGDEEKEYLKKTSEAMVKMRQKQKFSSRKRKGNFGGGGKHSKSTRRN